MKGRLGALGITALLAFVGTGFSDADEPTLATVRVDVQMVRVPVADSLTLIPGFQNAGTAQAAWDHLQEMLDDGRAKLIDWPVLWTHSATLDRIFQPGLSQNSPPPPAPEGARVVSENVDEVRYPTEFEPPMFPQTFSLPENEPKKTGRPSWEQFLPNAFEVRNAGPTVELEAFVEQGGKTVGLNLVVSDVKLMGFEPMYQQPAPIGTLKKLVEPRFTTSKVTSALRVRVDQPTLVGVNVLQEPEPCVELFLLRARVSVLPREALTPPIDPSDKRAIPSSPPPGSVPNEPEK